MLKIVASHPVILSITKDLKPLVTLQADAILILNVASNVKLLTPTNISLALHRTNSLESPAVIYYLFSKPHKSSAKTMHDYAKSVANAKQKRSKKHTKAALPIGLICVTLLACLGLGGGIYYLSQVELSEQTLQQRPAPPGR